MPKGRIILMSGPSGSGKGTLVKALEEKRGSRIYVSVSATTRTPRNGEIDGKSYFFLTKDEFEARIKDERMLEYASFCGNYYGTPKEPVIQALNDGKDVILEIEVQGAHEIKKKYPDSRMIFVVPPSGRILKDRLVGRGTEEAEVISKRLNTAMTELVQAADYDYILVNDDLEKAESELEDAIDGDIKNTDKYQKFLQGVIEDVKALSK